MAADDAAMRETCRHLRLIPLLVGQLHLDIHSMDEPPLPLAAANILSLSTGLPGTPRSPHKAAVREAAAAAAHGGGGVGGSGAASPLWRAGSGSSSGGNSPRTGHTPSSGERTVRCVVACVLVGWQQQRYTFTVSVGLQFFCQF